MLFCHAGLIRQNWAASSIGDKLSIIERRLREKFLINIYKYNPRVSLKVLFKMLIKFING